MNSTAESRSPAVRVMGSIGRQAIEIQLMKLRILQTVWENRKRAFESVSNAVQQKISEATRLAAECGVTPELRPDLFRGLLEAIKNENITHLFLICSPTERMAIMEMHKPRDDEVAGIIVQPGAGALERSEGCGSSRPWFRRHLIDDGFEEFITDWFEDDDDLNLLGIFQYALHLCKHLSGARFREVDVTGLEWVQKRLGDRGKFYNLFRMSPTTFLQLHDLLVNSYGLKSSTKSTSIEALGMFLWMVGAPPSVTQAEDRFERSLATISTLFDKVLTAVVKLAADIIKPSDPEFRTVNSRLRNTRFFPYFNDCIGALDGTHVPCVVPGPKMIQYLCHKGMTTQNVLAVCDFDMKFTFVLPGWPGSAHDMRVFEDATTTHSAHFPHPPAGKYYLVDSGYPNRIGYLAPYKGSKYHVPEFIGGPAPEGKEETFNYAHSSLMNVIERSFGVLKMKWRMLEKIPSYAPHKQSKIILACCALHNFIRSSGIKDEHFGKYDRDENFVPSQATANQPEEEEAVDESDVMNAFRDSIALALLSLS